LAGSFLAFYPMGFLDNGALSFNRDGDSAWLVRKDVIDYCTKGMKLAPGGKCNPKLRSPGALI